MTTIGQIARTLFPGERSRPVRRHSSRRPAMTLSQVMAVCFALLPLGTVIHAYMLTA